MKPILKYTLIGLLVFVIAGATVVGVAYAQGNGPDVREGLAELIGLTREELRDQLEDGKCYSCNEYNEDDPEIDAEFW